MQNKHFQFNFDEMGHVCDLVLIIFLPDPCEKIFLSWKHLIPGLHFVSWSEYTEINTKFRFFSLKMHRKQSVHGLMDITVFLVLSLFCSHHPRALLTLHSPFVHQCLTFSLGKMRCPLLKAVEILFNLGKALLLSLWTIPVPFLSLGQRWSHSIPIPAAQVQAQKKPRPCKVWAAFRGEVACSACASP